MYIHIHIYAFIIFKKRKREDHLPYIPCRSILIKEEEEEEIERHLISITIQINLVAKKKREKIRSKIIKSDQVYWLICVCYYKTDFLLFREKIRIIHIRLIN
jgi:hypothetical protein